MRIASALIITAAALSAEDIAVKPETQRVGDVDVKVENRKDFTFQVKPDADVLHRELWFQAFDGQAWGKWQKFGQVFQKDTPIVWAPPEGHWRVYLRKVLVSGLAGADPTKDQVKHQAEFIVDRTAPAAEITFPASKAKLRGGDTYTATWKASDPYLKAAPVTLVWIPGVGNEITVAKDIPNNGSFAWQVPRDLTTSGVLKVLIADKAGNVGSASVDGILVDSIKPKGRVTGPSIAAKADVQLETEVADQGGASLTRAQIWQSQDDGVSWTEGPVIADPYKSVAWKAPADGRFRLAIVGVDGAGNTTEAPKGKAGEVITIDTAAPAISLANATGIGDADKAGGARRHFKPGDRVQIPFTVKDPNLLANSVSIWWQNEPGAAWTELAKGQATDAAYRFTIAADVKASKAARVKVTATDLAGNTGESIAVESFEVQTAVVDDDVIVAP